MKGSTITQEEAQCWKQIFALESVMKKNIKFMADSGKRMLKGEQIIENGLILELKKAKDELDAALAYRKYYMLDVVYYNPNYTHN